MCLCVSLFSLSWTILSFYVCFSGYILSFFLWISCIFLIKYAFWLKTYLYIKKRRLSIFFFSIMSPETNIFFCFGRRPSGVSSGQLSKKFPCKISFILTICCGFELVSVSWFTLVNGRVFFFIGAYVALKIIPSA